MIEELTTQLRRDEGEKLHAYQDSLGFWKIGVGRLIDQRAGGGITGFESAQLLSHDIERVTRELDGAFPWAAKLSDPRRGVLLNMCFNMGLGKLRNFTHFLSAMQRGDWEAAAIEALDSKWAVQVGDRAKRLAKQITTDAWV
jgi:lysozyme